MNLEELERRSKDDHLAKMIVGSEVREVIKEVRRLRAALWNIGREVAVYEGTPEMDRLAAMIQAALGGLEP